MARIHTHYDNLKVARNAPPEVIRAAYKTLSQKYHPDRNPGSPDAIRIIKIINLAYEVLSDQAKRQEHDEWIERTEAEELKAAVKAGWSNTSGAGQAHAPQAVRRKSSSGSRRSHSKSLFRGFRPLEKVRSMWDHFSRMLVKKI
ncbi:MAG TPA: J domain-containing protein [Nitrosospira sp.]|jgi:DnaJ-class molecular chaperone|nr:J domain-containing protein [Nitrosospira sp.]